MRALVGVVALVGFFVSGPSLLASVDSQPTFGEQFVDLAAAPAQVSLAELASQVHPGRDQESQPRSFTNADLRLRPAPVPPATPPFPEIAPPTGILEHPAHPEIDLMQPAPQEQFGIPLYDGGAFLVPFGDSPRGRPSKGSRDRSGLLPPLPEPPSIFRKPVIDLFAVDRGFRSGHKSPSQHGTGVGTTGQSTSPRGGSPRSGGRGSAPGGKGRPR